MTPLPVPRFGRLTRDSIERGADVAFRVATIAAMLAGVRRRDPSVVVNGVLSLALAAGPDYLAAERGVRFRPWQRTWVSAAGLVHTVGMLGPYDRIWWWDHLAHTLSGVVVASATDVALRADPDGASRSTVDPRSRAERIAGVTLGFGVLWELLEYVVHGVADRLGFEPMLVHYGRLDAVGDVLFDLVGAGIVILFGRRGLANVVDSLSEPGDR